MFSFDSFQPQLGFLQQHKKKENYMINIHISKHNYAHINVHNYIDKSCVGGIYL